jgi:hypothetical protein
MRKFIIRLGVIPYLLLGLGMLALGLLALDHIVNTFWPFNVTRIDLLRATGLGIVDAPAILEDANYEFILAFLAAVVLGVSGLALPLVYFLNRRFDPQPQPPRFLLLLRQSMWIALWVAFCVWLQMNRAFGFAVATLVAVVFLLFEILLQIRTRAAQALPQR